ncbi:hypothetical protein CKC_04430 [Candidatus Liberibacter solanacearum CLso-ZC1]|uniref:Uncharacterized protein n=1 Tax=Liberibacter solanacearum (strain CLso-ZC1) TaxID=658172 RepID=E4UDF7_LIBSC|nr:hypothetical protein CKC_04430 [Candidatus Liberibacter solanacearum CLso-ZC1]
MLRKARWHFAIKRKLLQELDEPLVEDRYHTYISPHDCICIIDHPPSWIFEGKKILAAETPPLKIRYIARLQDLEDCDSLFLEILATNMALELCETLLGSESRKQTLRKEFEMLMDKAKTTGAIEMPPPKFISEHLMQKRFIEYDKTKLEQTRIQSTTQLDLADIKLGIEELKVDQPIRLARIKAQKVKSSSGVKWIDGFNSLIRPLTTFFLDYYLSATRLVECERGHL